MLSVTHRVVLLSALGVVLSAPRLVRAQVDAGIDATVAVDAASTGVPPDAASAPVQAPPLPELGAVATATRSPRPQRSVVASVSVLRRDEIDQNPTQSTDALLRSLPSAQTFRRSTSLTADPSAQGLNLRGVGPSGVSRTLVLLDGVPINDPFGGSIYWRALPRIGLERIEVVPSGSSALYGSAALAGVVQLFSRPLTGEPGTAAAHVQGGALDVDALYGSLRTAQLATRGSYRGRRVGAALEGEYLRSDGYRVVAADQAGAVDRAADSDHVALHGRVEARPTDRLRLASSLRLFREHQSGGTRYTRAAVDLALLSIEAALSLSGGGTLELRGFGRLQRFSQDRARITPDRSNEVLSAQQSVPSQDQGGSLVYRAAPVSWGGTHAWAVGTDVRRAQGSSRERVFPAQPMPSSLRGRDSGGEQLALGAFLQDSYSVRPWLELDFALRGDVWRNRAGRRVLQRESGAREQTDFAAQTELALSPRVGVLVRALDSLTLRASLYRAFRAPTLSELYRPFQVGTVLTAANAALGPELLHGFEAGLELMPRDALVLRATGFYNSLERPISNVTLALPAADGAERQRQNLGRARVRGVETSIEWRWAARLSSIVAYTLTASEVLEAGSMRELRGKALAQAPVHRASALLLLDEPRWVSASLQVRVLGAQYEDDLNTLRMRPFALVDLSLGRALVAGVELYAAIENLLDTDYLVGRAGIDTVGQPFVVRAGLRIRSPCL